MIVGIPKELKEQEYRVGITPEGVRALVGAGHSVLIEKAAGEGARLDDKEFASAGARIVGSHDKLFEQAKLILKIKEPIEKEFELLQSGQILFCYHHLASSKTLTKALLEKKVVGIAFETVETADGKYPLLIPMSRIAGQLAILEGGRYLQRTYGGLGVLVSKVSAQDRAAKILIIGAGTAGSAAAQTAISLGADVTIMDIDYEKGHRLSKLLNGKPTVLEMTPELLKEALPQLDLVVGAVLSPGDKAPYLITRDMLKLMQKGSVIVDVSIDQGGSVETSRPTTHADPTFEVDGIIHYCVANMPGCVPLTSTLVIATQSVPYTLEIANKGWMKALRDNSALAKGLNVCLGQVTYKSVADLFDLPYLPVEKALNHR